jgi:hypothetical protein
LWGPFSVAFNALSALERITYLAAFRSTGIRPISGGVKKIRPEPGAFVFAMSSTVLTQTTSGDSGALVQKKYRLNVVTACVDDASRRSSNMIGPYGSKRRWVNPPVAASVVNRLTIACTARRRLAMTTYTYVDNSNLYIEGCRVSAVRKGMAKSIHHAMKSNIVDHEWIMDYGKLYEFICEGNSVARLWGSPPPGDSFWEMLKRKHFNPTVYERNFANSEKKVDVAIAHRMTKDAYTVMNREMDDILLVAGNSDFVPVVADLVADGFKVEVAFWSQAARELRDLAVNFISLDPRHADFTKQRER